VLLLFPGEQSPGDAAHIQRHFRLPAFFGDVYFASQAVKSTVRVVHFAPCVQDYVCRTTDRTITKVFAQNNGWELEGDGIANLQFVAKSEECYRLSRAVVWLSAAGWQPWRLGAFLLFPFYVGSLRFLGQLVLDL